MEKLKASGFVPEGFTLFSYGVIQAIAEGVERAGSDDPVAVAEALMTGGPVETVLGPVQFDEKGDIADPRYDINKWSNGQYAKICCSDAAEGGSTQAQ